MKTKSELLYLEAVENKLLRDSKLTGNNLFQNCTFVLPMYVETKMKIILLSIGKTDATYLVEAIKEYQKRLEHYIPFEIQIIPDLKNTKNLTFDQQKEKEGELILKALQPGDYLVLLDDKGKEYTSMKFAEYIERKTHTVPKRLIFAIGGPYGFSQVVYNAASEKLTLSRMTFSHQMVRLIFVEQLYRAMTILNNEPYHHE